MSAEKKRWADRDGGKCAGCGERLEHFREINFKLKKVLYIHECKKCMRQVIRYERKLMPKDYNRYYNRFVNEDEHNKFVGKPEKEVVKNGR